MERKKLIAARAARNLSQPGLADAIGTSRESVSLWERGLATPHYDMILALCHFFEKDPAELDLAKELTEKELIMIQEILENRTVDRRQALAIVTLPAFKGVDLSSLSEPLVSPERFLSQCNAVIKVCWQLMKHGGFATVESVLGEYIPTLSGLASHQSDHQSRAASLMAQAKMLQVLLATHKLDFVAREGYCSEAVHFGELSGNSRVHTAAIEWQGYTYIYCYHQPQRAIAIFKQGLASLDSEALLSKTDISMGMAIAYAQDKEERESEGKALEMVKVARTSMPEYPELDPFYECIDVGASDLDRIEGRVYLTLAKRFSDRDYADKAYKIFDLSAGKQATVDRTLSEVLILKADAALALGDFREFAQCLEKGSNIALQIGSKKRKSEAMTVLNKAPDKWKYEQRYKKLIKMF